MKKLISTLLPGIVILLYAVFNTEGKNILEGIFLLFPLTFIVQGIICSDFIKELLIGFVISSLAFIIPINLLYNMGNCIDLLVFYNVLGVISYFVKKKIISKKQSD